MQEFYMYISDVVFLDELSDSQDVRIVHSVFFSVLFFTPVSDISIPVQSDYYCLP